MRARKAHRLAWLIIYGYLPEQLDHINRIKTDNRISNLRECSFSENLRNRPVMSTSNTKIKGISKTKSKTNPWVARISVDGKQSHIGAFSSSHEASLAYEAKAKSLHGDFYWKNKEL